MGLNSSGRSLQYETFEWENTGEWAFPSPTKTCSARDALARVKDALATLAQSGPQKTKAAARAAEEARLRAEAAKRQAEAAARQKAADDARRAEEARKAQVAQWQAQGLCFHCGGKKAMFSGKCKSCGK